MTDSPNDDLQARLSAQRLVLEWMLERIVPDEQTYKELADHIDARFPPQDGQEDPGAVPTGAFGDLSAMTAELRLLIDPIKSRLGVRDSDDAPS